MRVLAVGLLLVCVVLTGLHLLAMHEGPRWTSPLLLGDRLFDLGLGLTILWYSLALGRMLGRPLLGLSDEPLTENLAAMGLGMGILSLTLLGVGLLHLFYPPVFLCAALVLTFVLRAELGTLSRRAGEGILTWRGQGMPTAPTHGQRLVLLVLGLALVLISPRTALPPSYNSSATDLDTLAYHLAAPKIYIEMHGFVPRPDIPLANAPSGGDVLNVLGLMAGADTLGRMLNVLLTLLLGIAVYALGRRHFGQAGAWLGALLFYATNWLTPLAPTVVPDFAAAFLMVLGFSDLLAWASPSGGRRRPDNPSDGPNSLVAARWSDAHHEDLLLARAGLLIGLAVSFKLTNLPALPAAVLVAGAAALLQSTQAAAARLRHAAWAVALLVVFMLIPLAPWLIKNLCFFGTPFYPISVSISDSATPSTAALAATSAGLLPHLAHLWWIAGTLGATYWHYISPLCPLLILAPFVLRGASGRMAIILLVASGVLWLLFVPLFLPPRYWLGPAAVSDAVMAAVFCTLRDHLKRGTMRALFGLALCLDATLWLAAVPLGSVSASGLVSALAGELAIMIVVGILQWRQRRLWLELPVVALLCFGALIGMFVTLRETTKHQYLAVADGSLSREAYVTGNNWYYPAYEWANRRLPRNATVVLLNLVAGYYLDRQYLDDWYDERLSAVEGGPAARRAEFANWCRAEVHYAIFDSNIYFYTPHAYRWTRVPALHARTLYTANGVEVLAVSPCDAGHGVGNR